MVKAAIQNLRQEYENEFIKRDGRIAELEKAVATLAPGLMPGDNPSQDSVIEWEVEPFKENVENKIEKGVILCGDSIVKHVDMLQMTGLENSLLDCNIRKDVVGIRNRLMEYSI